MLFFTKNLINLNKKHKIENIYVISIDVVCEKEDYMRVNSVQSVMFRHQNVQKVGKLNDNPPIQLPQQPQNLSFKGIKGDSAIIGLGLGTIAGIAAFAVAIGSGGLAIPGLIAGYATAATGIAGSVAGYKVGEKIEKHFGNKNKE